MVGVDTQGEQALQQRRCGVIGQAGQRQCIAAACVHRRRFGNATTGQVFEQAFDHRQRTAARGLQQRRAALSIDRGGVGAGREQCLDDLAMAGERGLMQGAAALAVAGLDLGLELQQQLHAGRVVVLATGRGQQHRLAAGGFGAGAAFEQKFGQAPIADGAGDAERGQAVDVEWIEFGGGIAQ